MKTVVLNIRTKKTSDAKLHADELKRERKLRETVRRDFSLVVHSKDATFDYSHVPRPHTMVPERERDF